MCLSKHRKGTNTANANCEVTTIYTINASREQGQ